MISPISVSITAVDRSTSVIQKFNARIEKMQAPVKNMQRSLNRFAQLSGLNRLSEGFGRVQTSATGVFRVFGQIAPILSGITGAVTVAGISRLATSWANFGSNLQTTSQRLGMSTSALQTWQNGARLTGVSAESLTSRMKSLQDNMWNAVGGRAPEVMATFQQLHISMQNMDGSLRNTSEVLPEIADRIASIRNPTAQAAVATKLLGGAGEALLPFLRDGSAGMEKYRRMAQRYGVINEAGASAANRLRQAQTELTLSVEGFGNSVAQAVEPVLTPVTEAMSNWIAQNRTWIAQDISNYIQEFVNWLKSIDWQGVKGGLEQIYQGVQQFSGSIQNIIEKIGSFKTVLEVVAGFLGLRMIGTIFGVIAPFASFAMTIGRLVIPALFSLLAAMGPVGWAIVAAGVIIGGVTLYIRKHWDTFAPYWDKIWAAIQATTSFAIKYLLPIFFPFTDIVKYIINHWKPLPTFFNDLLNGIRDKFSSALKYINGIVDKISSAINTVKNAVGLSNEAAAKVGGNTLAAVPQIQPLANPSNAGITALPTPMSSPVLAVNDNLQKIQPQSMAPVHANINNARPKSLAPINSDLSNYINRVSQGNKNIASPLMALIMTESGGRMVGNSTTSAFGFTQLTNGAAKNVGVNKYDPFQNVLGGWLYYQKMLKKVKGNLIAAYGAYHDGGNSKGVKRFLASGGTDFSLFSAEGKKAMNNFQNYLQQANKGGLPFNYSVGQTLLKPQGIGGNVTPIMPIDLNSGFGQLPANNRNIPFAPAVNLPMAPNGNNDSGEKLLLEIDIKGKPQTMDVTPKSRSSRLTLQSVSYQRAMDPVQSAGGL